MQEQQQATAKLQVPPLFPFLRILCASCTRVGQGSHGLQATMSAEAPIDLLHDFGMKAYPLA